MGWGYVENLINFGQMGNYSELNIIIESFNPTRTGLFWASEDWGGVILTHTIYAYNSSTIWNKKLKIGIQGLQMLNWTCAIIFVPVINYRGRTTHMNFPFFKVRIWQIFADYSTVTFPDIRNMGYLLNNSRKYNKMLNMTSQIQKYGRIFGRIQNRIFGRISGSLPNLFGSFLTCYLWLLQSFIIICLLVFQ